MAQAYKTLRRMRENPRDWRLASLEVVANRFGIRLRRSGGSHVVFMHEDSEIVVTVPARRPIKPIHIRQFLALVDDIGESR